MFVAYGPFRASLMCLVDNKNCCCRTTCETTDCCGDKGLISDIEKYCCIVNSCSLTPACGCCNMWLFGRPHGEGMEHQDGDGGDEFMTGVFWLSYCVFMGTGVTAISPCDPFYFIIALRLGENGHRGNFHYLRST